MPNKLVIIYGPPAVGKTTIGKKVAQLTDYRFFFNHLTVPAAKAIFPDSHQPWPDERYTKLLHQLRIDCLTAASKADFDTIFTIAYSGKTDNPFMTEIANTFLTRGGHVHFVELHAPENILLQRVANPSRANLHLGKVTDPIHLKEILKVREVYASVDFPEILKLDTSQLEPFEAAREIVDKLQLLKQS